MVLMNKQTNRSVEQNRESEIDFHKYNQVVFDQGAKTIQQRTVSSTNGAKTTAGLPCAKL